MSADQYIAEFEKSSEEKSPSLNDRIGYVNALFQKQRYQDVVTACTKALEITSCTKVLQLSQKCEKLRRCRYGAYVQLQKWSEALSDIDILLADFGEDATRVNCRGCVLRRLKRHQEAMRDFTRAFALNPHNPDVSWNCGGEYLARGNYRAAFQHFKIALGRYGGESDRRACQEKLMYIVSHFKMDEEVAEWDKKLPQAQSPSKKRKSSSSPASEERDAKRTRSIVWSWTVMDVVRWIKQIAPVFEPYAEAVRINAVDGPTLLAADAEFFIELGVKNLVHRTRLLAHIALMKDVKWNGTSNSKEGGGDGGADGGGGGDGGRGGDGLGGKKEESGGEEKSTETSLSHKQNAEDDDVKMIPAPPKQSLFFVDLCCCICLDKPKCILLDPCGHVPLCETCSNSALLTACPICLKKVTSRRKVYV